MKKITAFFMALLPVFVMVLLFTAGIIVKSSTHVYVQSVEIPDKSLVVQKTDEEHDKTLSLSARVLPMNATNPELYWKSSDENILTVDNQGNVACKKYGEAYVYAISKENQTISSSCKVEINDTEIHNVVVSDADKYDIAYIGLNERKPIKTTLVPATGIIDPTLTYEVDEDSKDYIDVTQDGLILPKATTPAGKKAKINISPATGTYKSRVTPIEIQIGVGIEQVCLKDETSSVTSTDSYNLYDQINTYPEKTNVSATDFVYTSDNEDIATIDENGTAKFKQAGQVKLSAAYKRDNSKSISKTVYSTCDWIANVDFNCEEYTQDIEYKDGAYVETDLESDKFYCEVYPESKSKETKYEITSSDDSVLLPTKQDDGSYKFTAKKPGCVMLLAKVLSGPEKADAVYDACYVTVTSTGSSGTDADEGLIAKSEVKLDEGVFYYPLINALNLQDDKRTPYDISFSLNSGDAYIDDNNILHFTKAGDAEVSVRIGSGLLPTECGTIKITATDKVTDLDTQEQIVINVGQRYKFKDGKPVFESKSYEDYFDVDDDETTFTAKQGCKIDEFELSTSNGQNKTIKLIVKEDPIYITNTLNAFFTTTQIEYEYKKQASIAIVPSTATKADGTGYNLSYSYEMSNDSIKVEDDKITFSAEGIVKVTTKCDDTSLTLNSWFKSTFGKLSKFVLKDSAGETVRSNSNVTYEDSPLVYTITDLTYSEAEQIKAEPIVGSSLCDIKKDIERQSLLSRYYDVTFTITSKASLYGVETIAFTSDAYTIYLNVTIPAVMTDATIMFGRETLSSNTTSFVKNLTLNIVPYPALPTIVGKEDAYTVKLNDESVEVKDNTVTIDLNAGDNKLEIFAKDSSTALKTYTLNYETDWSKLKVSMTGADEKNNIYISSKETQKVLYLKANGLVPSTFFASDNFQVKLDGTHSETGKMTQDILTLTNLPAPDGTEYSLGLTLSYKEDTTEYPLGNFKVNRDLVSKIVLPNHDNNDMTDKKGLQKVHVYGNKSYYDPTEKTIDGYRLPIEIYDYKGNLIKNTKEKPNAKELALKSLDLSIDKNCTYEYDAKNDCILIKFAAETLYSEKEISQDLFDAKDGAKNVTFVASTKSKAANAQYTFVPVEGMNVYCQEGLQEADSKDKPNGTVVLQTNFGVPGLEKDNAKFEVPLNGMGGIYGNGYTLCTAYQIEHMKDKYYLGMHFAFNTLFEGCSDQYYMSMQTCTGHQITFRQSSSYQESYFMYSTYKNFSNGIGYSLNDPQMPVFKNSLFYNNKVASLETVDDNGDALIENCVFFNCGGLPLLVCKGGFHFKGYVGIYNFHNKEAFKDIFGTDLSSMWPIIESAAKAANMTEIGADGRLYVNSFMASAITDKLYFWNAKKQEFEKGTAGTPDAANFIAKYVDLKIPFTSLNACLWATYNRTVDPASFSYYDEYDKDGNIRLDFLQNQISKLLRHPTYF